jgi:hypothetical protein
MTGDTVPTSDAPRHAAGMILIACAVMSVVLLANHPGGQPHDFAEVLKDEAANQAMDAIIHGSFILVMALQFVCFAVFGARLGTSRMAVLAALTFTAAGYAAMSASMIADGLLTPAVAVKYLATPDKVDIAKGLFVLIGTSIRFLMPIGLLFQALGIASWGVALVGRGRIARAAGILGIVVGGALIAALAATYTTLNPVVLMGGLAAAAAWSIAVGSLLMRRQL